MDGEKRRRLANSEYTMVALVFLGVLLLLAVVIWVPKLSFIQPGGLTNAKDRAQAESDLRGHLLQALAGLVLAVGAFYTGRTFAQNRKEQDRTFALAREGQITERFTRAVSQLADEKLDIRLGGIYALERIARDSETHYESVMEVLTAFLRENTRWRREIAAKETEDALGESEELDEEEDFRPTVDFQAVATVLGRRDRRHERADYQLNLSAVDLRGAWLREAALSKAKLNQADLSGAILLDADLSGAFLYLADLTNAVLSEANLRRANLMQANLSGATVHNADLSGTDLTLANLARADLEGAIGLTQEQLDLVRTVERAKLPEYLQEGDSQEPGGEPKA
jgi:hypothetical protein